MKRKEFEKKVIAALTAGLMALSLAACGGSGAPSQESAQEAPAGEEAAQTPEAPADQESEGTVYKVGIVKFMDHASLNQIESNIQSELDALSDGGVTYDYASYTKNGQGDPTTINQIVADLMASEVDVIVPIATPAAQIAQSVTEGKDLPIVFSAVSDPVSAGLTASVEAPGANITGTSDYLNTNAIMDLIFSLDPEADYVGLLYSNSEDASRVPIQDAKAYLDEKGVKYIEKTGTTTDEVSQAVDALIAEDVDAVFTPTDNTIMNAELAFFEKLSDAGIPHYAGADSFALNGAFCGFGVDYAQLGRETAKMADEILRGGADTAALSVRTFDNGIATINTDTCAALGLDTEAVKEAFGPYVTQIIETATQQNFEQ
jgi:putative ABC transport system substrate-binding protein